MTDRTLDITNILPLFSDAIPGVKGYCFDRNGGISKAPYHSNNISYGVGDREENIAINRQSLKVSMGISTLVSAHQVHGDRIFHVGADVRSDCEVQLYDALITDQVGIGLMIQHADCQAVLIYDTEKRVLAAVHNGWKGSVANIIAKTIGEMSDGYRCKPENMVVGIGPSLGPCCGEFIHYRKELPEKLHSFQVSDNHFDFWQISKHQLMQCGVPETSICTAETCTSCSEKYFSYRRARRSGNGITGRNGSVAVMVTEDSDRTDIN